MFRLLFLFLCLFIFNNSIKAQTFGFGCLGFVGGYGGYSYQVYSPKGLNDFIRIFNDNRQDSIDSRMSDFGKAKGFRVGLNFFRADLEGLILTAKGYYQFLEEKHEASEQLAAGNSTTKYEVEIKNWGIGVDLGTAISDALVWKVIDAAILFNRAKYTNTFNAPGAVSEIMEYESDSQLGYTIGTGFILDIIDDYITLEGVAAFTVLTIDKVQTQDGVFLTVNENSNEVMQNFIDAGGFNAVIQLNIGFPL